MKSNKKPVILIAFLLLLNLVTVQAQNSAVSGIYLNVHDYETGKLFYTRGKIKLRDFLASSFVNVVIDGKPTKLNKNSIFGYRNSKNETYRFYKKHDEEFLILENKAVVLYSSYTRISSNNGKTNHLVQAYFFSKTTDSEILPLTISNLKKAFPDNIKFHDMLDTEFSSDEALSAFSEPNKMYTINYLLTKSDQ
jgi:hypothetical protein